MPDVKSAIWSLVLNIVNITVLFVILRALVYKPVKKYMSARTLAISSDIEAAELKLKQADELKQQRDSELASVAESAETVKRRVLGAAESQALEITAAAEAEAERIREASEIKAQRTADLMLDEMREKIADLSIEIAGRVLEREVSKSDNQDIIDNYFNRVV